MYIWACKVRLQNNNIPNFNDSNKEINYQIGDILDFSLAFLKSYKTNNKDFRSLITREFYKKFQENKLPITIESYLNNRELIHLPETGWTIIRIKKIGKYV